MFIVKCRFTRFSPLSSTLKEKCDRIPQSLPIFMLSCISYITCLVVALIFFCSYRKKQSTKNTPETERVTI